MKTTLAKVVFTASTALLAGCGGPGKAARDQAKSAVDHLGCKTSQSEMWNALHRIAEDGGRYPDADELRAALLSEGSNRSLQGERFNAYVDAFVHSYSVTISGIQDKLDPGDLATWKKALAEMEVGVQVTDVHTELHTKIQSALASVASEESQLGVTCSAPGGGDTPPILAPPHGSVWEQLKSTDEPEIYGMRRTLATVYQSCDVLSLPAMSLATPSVSGITILPEPHPAGGRKRVYGNLQDILDTHYYIKGMGRPKTSCFNVRSAPAIYDFGGKPYTTSREPKVLDFFRSAGSGTSVLGVDCSAFVFSSLALAGLKMDPDPNKILKADLVHGIGSRAFKEPQSNGLRCLSKITVTATTSILPGDVVAINGHVVMIDTVGADPFGLGKIRSSADCTAANLPYSNFDFVFAQSSPSKNGIGINRFQARDYLRESSTYRDGMTRYAVAACRAKFGLSASVDTSSLSVTRHKKTPECLAEEPLVATREECVDSCPAL